MGENIPIAISSSRSQLYEMISVCVTLLVGTRPAVVLETRLCAPPPCPSGHVCAHCSESPKGSCTKFQIHTYIVSRDVQKQSLDNSSGRRRGRGREKRELTFLDWGASFAA